VNGFVHRVPLATRDPSEAERRERQSITALRRAQKGFPRRELGRYSFSHAADNYLWECAVVKGMFRSRRPRYNKRNILTAWNTTEGRLLKRPCSFFNFKPLCKITADDILKYQAIRLDVEARLKADARLKVVEQESRRLFRLFRWAGVRIQMYSIQDALNGHWIYTERFGWEYNCGRQIYSLPQGWHTR
jgi:hypothetical protein